MKNYIIRSIIPYNINLIEIFIKKERERKEVVAPTISIIVRDVLKSCIFVMSIRQGII